MALDAVTGWLKRLNRYMGAVERASGLLLILIGVLLLTDGLSAISRLFRLGSTGVTGACSSQTPAVG